MPYGYICWFLIKWVLPCGIAALACTGLIAKVPAKPEPQPRWEPPHTDWRAWTPPEKEE